MDSARWSPLNSSWSPLNRRARAELGYVLTALPLAAAGFLYAYAMLFVGGPLSLTTVGLPVLVVALTGARWLGSVHRGLATRRLGVAVAAPEKARRRPGFMGWLRSGLTDAAGWRALLYLLLKGPLGVAEAMAGAFMWVNGLDLISLTYPLPFSEDPRAVAEASDPASIGLFNPVELLSPLLPPVLGVAFLLASPWAVRAVLLVDMMLLKLLLGSSESSLRIRHLEETRTHAVEEADDRLRRIERDLHDGAQVRLVTLAMHLGAAKERLAGLPEADPALSGLIGGAHQNAKDALVELRGLVRGIHPPILDHGLEAALTTLAASSSVPVRLNVTLPRRPSPAIESIAYFCTAELLANVAKHSRARQAAVTVTEHHGRLRITVRDDGAGGVRMRNSGGLAGLKERVGTVDGRLTIDSPDGGPTTVSITLPLHA